LLQVIIPDFIFPFEIFYSAELKLEYNLHASYFKDCVLNIFVEILEYIVGSGVKWIEELLCNMFHRRNSKIFGRGMVLPSREIGR
jgi:hypothetical protein